MSLLKDLTKTKGTTFVGHVLVSTYDVLTTQAGKPYLRGTFVDADGDKGLFVKWDIQKDGTDFKTMPGRFTCVLTATYDEYNGKPQYKVEKMADINVNVDLLQWTPRVISNEEGMARLRTLLTTHMTPVGRELFQEAYMFPEFKGGHRFFTEPASLSVHDAGVGGLLSHSLKVAEYAVLVMEQHKDMFADEKLRDIFLLGCLLHDWGKMLTHDIEDPDNSISPRIFLEHRYLFMEFLLVNHPEFLAKMIEIYGERLKDEFISIIMQHHGAYDERPRTMTAYLAHMVDYMESRITIAMEAVKDGKQTLQLTTDISVRVNTDLYYKK